MGFILVTKAKAKGPLKAKSKAALRDKPPILANTKESKTNNTNGRTEARPRKDAGSKAGKSPPGSR